MKTISKYLPVLLLFAIASAVVINVTASGDGMSEADEQYARSTLQYAPDADTITDAENDTLLVDYRFWSHWMYGYTVDVTNISGTTSVIAIVQERMGDTSGDWFEVERDTLSAAGQIRFPLSTSTDPQKGQVQGRRQRLILDGSGTQSSRYTILGTYRYW